MGLGKPSQAPIPPQGGFAEDPNARCSACHTILSLQHISVKLNGVCHPIAKISLCNTCRRIGKRWIIQGRYVDGIDGGKEYIESVADKHKISKVMIKACMAEHPGIYSFTLSELRSANPGAIESTPTGYNPDRYIEPKDEPLF